MRCLKLNKAQHLHSLSVGLQPLLLLPSSRHVLRDFPGFIFIISLSMMAELLLQWLYRRRSHAQKITEARTSARESPSQNLKYTTGQFKNIDSETLIPDYNSGFQSAGCVDLSCPNKSWCFQFFTSSRDNESS